MSPTLAVLVLLTSSPTTAIEKCPLGGKLHGTPPPTGRTQWCEADDLFGRRRRSGPFRQWHDNGRLELEGGYLDGKPHGQFYRYSMSGVLVGTASYDYGRRTSGSLGIARRKPSNGTDIPTPRRDRDAVVAEPTSYTRPVGASKSRRSADLGPTRRAVVRPDDDDTGNSAVTVRENAKQRHSYPFVYSGRGPGAGDTAFGIGGRLLLILPMLDLHFLYGFTDRLDLETRVTTIGIANFADLGVRFRVVGDESFSLALRASGNFGGVFALVASATSLGPMPGATVAFGDEDWQLSLSQDVPIHVFQSVDVGDVGATANVIAVQSRTTAAYETLVGKDTSLYVALQVYVPLVQSSATVIPFLGVGASW